MPITLIKFTQGLNTAAAGIAVVGSSVDGPVIITNGDDTGVSNWVFELLDAPIDSSLSTGVLGAGVTNFVSLNPDVSGCYRIRLITSDSIGNYDTDIRNFAIPNSNGWVIPPYQKNPDPIDLGTKPDELNFSGQGRGWADGVYGLLGTIFNDVDIANVPDPITGTLGAVLAVKAGTSVFDEFIVAGTALGSNIWCPTRSTVPSGNITAVTTLDQIGSTFTLNVLPIVGAPPGIVLPGALTNNGVDVFGFGTGSGGSPNQVFKLTPGVGVTSASSIAPSTGVNIESISSGAPYASGVLYISTGSNLLLVDPTTLSSQTLTGFVAQYCKHDGGSKVCIVNNDGVNETVSIINTTTALVTGAVLTPKAALTGGITFGAGFFWILTLDDSTLSRNVTISKIDPNGGGPGVPTVVTTFNLGFKLGSTLTPVGITFDSVSSKIWIGGSDPYGFGFAKRINISTGSIETNLSFKFGILGVLYTNGFIYAGGKLNANPIGSGVLVKIDSTAGSVSKLIGSSSIKHYELELSDRLEISFVPTNYSPVVFSPITNSITQLTSHLYGIDTVIGSGRTELTNINEVKPTFLDTLVANVDNYPTPSATWDKARFLSIDTAANFNITGFNTTMFNPLVLFGFVSRRHIINTSAVFSITLKHQDVLSTAANRIICPNGVDLVLGPSDVATIVYDMNNNRWRVISYVI